MKLFKNGINVKWFLLGIVIVAGIWLGVASVNPIISNEHSYLDILHVTYLHGDISNVTGRLSNASLPISAANESSSNEYTGTAWQRGNISLGSVNNTATVAYYNRFDYVIFDNLGTLPSTDSAACFEAATGRFRINLAQTCTVSDIYKKTNISTVTESLIPKLMQLQLIRYQDKNDPAKRWRYGYSAQAVAKISPELVGTDYRGTSKPIGVIIDQTDEKEKMLYSDGTIANITSVNYEMIAALDAKVIQEQQLNIEILQNQMRNICTNDPVLCS